MLTPAESTWLGLESSQSPFMISLWGCIMGSCDSHTHILSSVWDISSSQSNDCIFPSSLLLNNTELYVLSRGMADAPDFCVAYLSRGTAYISRGLSVGL